MTSPLRRIPSRSRPTSCPNARLLLRRVATQRGGVRGSGRIDTGVGGRRGHLTRPLHRWRDAAIELCRQVRGRGLGRDLHDQRRAHGRGGRRRGLHLFHGARIRSAADRQRHPRDEAISRIAPNRRVVAEDRSPAPIDGDAHTNPPPLLSRAPPEPLRGSPRMGPKIDELRVAARAVKGSLASSDLAASRRVADEIRS